VLSDWGGTHSTVASALNGLDQEQNIGPGTYFSKALMTAVQQHKVPVSTINEMVTRIMWGMFSAGLFDYPAPPEPKANTAIVNTPHEKAIALEAAEGGAVLLKNSSGALPLTRSGDTIALIGLPATPAGAQQYYQGGGSSKVPLFGVNPAVVDPLSAVTLRAEANGDVVIPAPGATTADAVAAATLAKTAVVFIGDSETEGSDRKSLDATPAICVFVCLPSTGPDQNALVSAVANANPNTIVVVQAGGPVSMPWLKQVKGVLHMWYPGEQDGNAAAALLFGDVNPSGKLPLTFPKSTKQGPLRSVRQYPGVTIQDVPHSFYTEKLLVGYRWYMHHHLTPLFPFGYGLSYTKFRLSRLAVHATKSGATARFAVKNIGTRPGAEVGQLYVGFPKAAHEPPLQLKGYDKVFLQPGERRWITLDLDRRAFSYWNTKANRWRVAPGCYTIRVGDSSAHLPLRGRVCRRDS
jgi:beta-glucosidase